MPEIAIIIPHFNRAQLLRETLQSLVHSCFTDWEAIVVDDGSTPDQWEAARTFDDSRITFMQRTDGLKGPSRCRNLGLRESAAPLVLFLDSDDVLAPWCLGERVASMRSDTTFAFVVFPVMLFQSQPGDSRVLWNSLDGSDDVERFLNSDPPWHTSSPVWRRDALAELGGFDEQIMYGDDSDLHARAILSGLGYTKRSVVVPDVFVRRSQVARITNSASANLLDSRLVRLKRGAALLESLGTARHRELWQGQFFAEAEFFLFSQPKERARLFGVLSLWTALCHPSALRRAVVYSYFLIATVTRVRAYVLLRLARRAARMLLPSAWFANATGQFEAAPLSDAHFKEVEQRLQALSNAGQCA